ncbi:hypothetical protein [Cronobacter malonaticus]|uniref:hypothetical protein n=1 Tax=Cronobacter malonaticus TaxID=413503 RepID=UPI0035E3BFD9
MWSSGINQWVECDKGRYEAHAHVPAQRRVLYTAPPAPVVPAETFEEWSRRCEIQLTLCRPEFREVAEITWNACRDAMLAAPGKQPLSVDVLAGALRNAPLAPADNQGRQRAPVVPDGLKRAVEFYEQVKRENTPAETGAWKDAVNWVLDEACREAMLQPVSQPYKLTEKEG